MHDAPFYPFTRKGPGEPAVAAPQVRLEILYHQRACTYCVLACFRGVHVEIRGRRAAGWNPTAAEVCAWEVVPRVSLAGLGTHGTPI